MKQILMAKDLWKNVKFSNVHEYYRDITSTAHKSLMKSYKPPIKTSTTTTTTVRSDEQEYETSSIPQTKLSSGGSEELRILNYKK